MQNPRNVPGILAAPDLDDIPDLEEFPYKSDYDHPTVFWITNGWNDFQYNMAAGAGACGACYWFVTAANSTISRTVDGKGERWESYASLQATLGQAGATPLMELRREFLHLGHDVVHDRHQDRGLPRRGQDQQSGRLHPGRSEPDGGQEGEMRRQEAEPRLLSDGRRLWRTIRRPVRRSARQVRCRLQQDAAVLRRQSGLHGHDPRPLTRRPSTGRRSTSRRSGSGPSGIS